MLRPDKGRPLNFVKSASLHRLRWNLTRLGERPSILLSACRCDTDIVLSQEQRTFGLNPSVS